jgi:hypothetical protein
MANRDDAWTYEAAAVRRAICTSFEEAAEQAERRRWWREQNPRDTKAAESHARLADFDRWCVIVNQALAAIGEEPGTNRELRGRYKRLRKKRWAWEIAQEISLRRAMGHTDSDGT